MKDNFWSQIEKPILALAPMAGITDSAFRQVCRKFGADVTYSEMASATALFFKPQRTLELVRFKAPEKPYVIQLFGNVPEHFAKAAKILTEKVKPDGIDINFGCPARKVFGHGSGCAIMPQKKLARDIISAVCQNTTLPVSIKIRAGVKNMSAMHFIENTNDLLYSTVMIHCRTYDEGFNGPADFNIAQEAKKAFPEKIVLGNGGIFSAENALTILKNFPLLDGLGIARGTWGKPWIFEDIKTLLSGRQSANRDFKRIKEMMLEHAQLIFEDKGKTGLFEIRKHMAWYVKGFSGAAELRKRLVTADNMAEIRKILDLSGF